MQAFEQMLRVMDFIGLKNTFENSYEDYKIAEDIYPGSGNKSAARMVAITREIIKRAEAGQT